METIDFEDLKKTIPAGYHDLSWGDFIPFSSDNPRLAVGITSGTHAVVSTGPVTTLAAASGHFTIGGLEMTVPGTSYCYYIIHGFTDGVETHRADVIVDDVPSYIRLNWSDISSVEFDMFALKRDPNAPPPKYHFVMDDLKLGLDPATHHPASNEQLHLIVPHDLHGAIHAIA